MRNIKDLFVIGDTDDFDSLCQLVRISPVHDIKRNPKDGNKVKLIELHCYVTH